MKYKIPIRGSLLVEAEDDGKAETIAARWIFDLARQNEGRRAQLPDCFADASKPGDIAVVVD